MRIAGLSVHIVAGAIGILSGFLALYAVGGGRCIAGAERAVARRFAERGVWRDICGA